MLKQGHKLVMILPEKNETSQLITSEIPVQVIVEMPQSLIFPEEDHYLQPLLSEIPGDTLKNVTLFSYQPKKDLFAQHAQKQKIILKNNDDDDQKKQIISSFKTLVEKKAQKHISKAPSNTQKEYESIVFLVFKTCMKNPFPLVYSSLNRKDAGLSFYF